MTFRRALAVVALVGLVLHGAILVQNVGANPFAQVPVVDAEVYWQWAGRIAGGELVGDEPFVAAPLYPYLLGVLRLLGGGLTAVYVVQLLLHVATALLIARAGNLRFGARTGLVAAVVWLLLGGPAYYAGRVLACTLQAFCVALTLERGVVFARGLEVERSSSGVVTSLRSTSRERAVQLGIALGVTCLAWPPMLLAVPVVALWAWALVRREQPAARAARTGGLVLVSAGLAIAPATLHNLAASGELVPISAHAGITFYHGNNPEADGTFSAVGVTNDKRIQDRQALEQARAALGDDVGWKATSSFFFDRGLAWWRAEPGAALALAGRKLWWCLSGRVYGDMYLPAIEREEDFASRLWLAPLPVAWWTLAALVAAFLLLRRAPLTHLPEIGCALLPIVVCTVFWYSPRYRMPGAPAIALLGAWALVQLFEHERLRTRIVAAVAFVAAIAAGPINRGAGFDDPADYRPLFELRLGDVYERLGEPDAARKRFEKAVVHGHPGGRVRLANLLRGSDPASAVAALRELAESLPGDAFAQRSYAVALAETGRADLAQPIFEAALALDASDYQSHSGLGGALVQLGHPADALAHFDRALEIRADAPGVHYNRGVALARLRRTEEAIDEWRAELALDPDHEDARGAGVNALRALGHDAEAVEEGEAMLQRSPDHVGARLVLAWIYATCPDAAVRDGARALQLTAPLAAGDAVDPGVLDTRAAALAETGDFGGAAAVAERSAAGWRALGNEPEALVVEARRALYLAGKPYREE